jgi:hypothetical protein
MRYSWMLLIGMLAACSGPAAVETATLLPPTATSQPRTAQLSELRNAVTIRDTNAAEWGTASVGQVFGVSGGVRTGAESRARVDTSEGSIVRIAANTEFELLEFPPDTHNPITRLKLEAGQVWVIVTRGLADGRFEIETPTGIATVRGSLMSVTQAPSAGPLLITCLEGACRLRNPTGSFVDLVAGQQSTITAPGQDPAPPAPMTTAQFNDWLQEVPEALAAATAFLSAGTATPPPTPTSPGPASSTLPGSFTAAQFPHLAFDNQGVLHLVYEARGTRVISDYFHQQLGTDGAWAEPEAMTTEFAALFGSLQLVAQTDGSVCAVWNGAMTNDIGTFGVYRRCFASGAGAELLLPAYGTAREFHFRPAPDGQLRGVFLTGAGTLRYLPPRARVASEDSPDTPRLSDVALAVMPQFAADARGGLHVAWVRLGEAGSDPFTVRYRFSSDDGQTWGEPQTLSDASSAPDGLSLQLVADGQGNVHLAWNGGDGLYYRRWTNTEGWGAAVRVTGEERGPSLRLAVNADGLARALWFRADGVRFAEQDADGGWLAPRAIGSATSLDVAFALDAQDRAHAVWILEDQLRYGTAP